MADTTPAKHNLVVFTEADCRLILKALGHYSAEYARTDEVAHLNRIIERLS